MSLQYTINHDGQTLRSEATGQHASFQEVQDYLMAVAMSAMQHQSRHVLCDETALYHNIGIAETYRLAEQLAQFAQYEIRVVLICNDHTYERAKFYEDAAVNRGMLIKVFLQKEDAEQWLFSEQ